MRPLSAREVEAYLKRCGFHCERAEGSHFKWVNPDTGRWTIVPHHGNRTMAQGILLAIFRQAGITPPKK